MISYHRARGLVLTYRAASLALFGLGTLILLAFYSKAVYNVLAGCRSPFLFVPCRATVNLIVQIYQTIPGIQQLWEWVPNVADNSLLPVLYSPAILVAFFLWIYAGYLKRIARELSEDLTQARRQARSHDMAASLQVHQSVGNVNAGGDVLIHQTIASDKPSMSPTRNFVFGVLGATMAAVIGQLINVWLGLTH